MSAATRSTAADLPVGSRRHALALIRDEHALVSITPVFAIVGGIIAAVLAFIVIGALISPFLSATESVTDNFSTGSTGNSDADTLLSALGPVIPILAVVVLFGMIIGALVIRMNNG
jgi:hypothetical protein